MESIDLEPTDAERRLDEARQASFGGRVDSARTAYADARTAFERSLNSIAVARAVSELAALELSVGRGDAARILLENALRLSKDSGDAAGQAVHLRRLGDLEASLGNCDAAMKRYEASRTLCRELSDDVGEALTWLQVGTLLVAMSRYDEGRDAFDRAHALHWADADPADSASLSRCIGDLERRVGRMDEAAAAYRDARSRYSSLSVLSRGYLHFGLGELARMRSEPGAAAELRTALELFTSCGHSSGEGLVHCAMGEMARSQGEADQAYDEFQAAIVLLRGVNNRLGLGNARRGLGLVERNRGRYTEAKRAFREARVCYRSARHEVGEAHALRGMGEIDHLLDHDAEARASLTKALTLYRSLGQPQGEANTQLTLGDLELKIKALDAAQAAYQRAHTLYLEVDDPQGVVNALRSLACIDLAQGHQGEARRKFTDALVKYEELRVPSGAAECHAGLAEVEFSIGNDEEALKHCDTALSLYRKLDQQLGCAQVLMIQGQVLLVKGLRADAADLFDQAATTFDLLGHHHERQQAQDLASEARSQLGSEGRGQREDRLPVEQERPDGSDGRERTHLVIIVPGIRDRGLDWNGVRNELEAAGLKATIAGWSEFFGIPRFLVPAAWFRRVAMRSLLYRIENAIQTYTSPTGQQPMVSYVAHSFGSYILCYLLRRKHHLKTHRLILCGSVLSRTFKFAGFEERFHGPVLNDVGNEDYWPFIASCVTFGYGTIGTFGAAGEPVKDRFHEGAGHDHFSKPGFCSQYWIPFLLASARQGIEPGGAPRGESSLRRSGMRLLQNVKWLALAGAVWLVAAGPADRYCDRRLQPVYFPRGPTERLALVGQAANYAVGRIQEQNDHVCRWLPAIWPVSTHWPPTTTVERHEREALEWTAACVSRSEDEMNALAKPSGIDSLRALNEVSPGCLTIRQGSSPGTIEVLPGVAASSVVRVVPVQQVERSWRLCGPCTDNDVEELQRLRSAAP